MDKKITEDMLTDEYLADHIGEMQQYLDKLNAFNNLMSAFPWYLAPKEGEELTPEENADQGFMEAMIKKRITSVADHLNTFMDHHYAVHGMVQPITSKFYKAGGVPGNMPDFSGNLEYKEDSSWSNSQEMLKDMETVKEFADRKEYRELKNGMIGQEFYCLLSCLTKRKNMLRALRSFVTTMVQRSRRPAEHLLT
ncbi:MAG: hypothetical protein K6B14_02390 [Lachnospiraceae bacterium]|nr:hypothetical protein [Lachnospiraceae bacterium]